MVGIEGRYGLVGAGRLEGVGSCVKGLTVAAVGHRQRLTVGGEGLTLLGD